MPGKLKAKIVAGRHLPVMDRASDLTDAFVEVSDAGGAGPFSLCSHVMFISGICRFNFFQGEIRKYDFQNGRLPQIPESSVELRVVQV